MASGVSERRRAPAARGSAFRQRARKHIDGTPADLIISLEEARAARRPQQRLKVLTHLPLLVVDEIGYLPVSRTGGIHFFQLMTRRYETASTVLTSNKGFEDWGEVFGDDVMTAALIARLLHHCHVVSIRGNSYRMRHHTDVSPSSHPPGTGRNLNQGEARSAGRC